MRALEQIILDMADKDAIRDVCKRYADRMWHDDPTGLVELFTTDGRFIVRDSSGDTVIEGQPSLLALYRDAVSSAVPRPYVHNHLVTLHSAERASGRSYVELRSAADNMKWIGTGYYEDEYVKLGGIWRIASRTFFFTPAV